MADWRDILNNAKQELNGMTRPVSSGPSFGSTGSTAGVPSNWTPMRESSAWGMMSGEQKAKYGSSYQIGEPKRYEWDEIRARAKAAGMNMGWVEQLIASSSSDSTRNEAGITELFRKLGLLGSRAFFGGGFDSSQF